MNINKAKPIAFLVVIPLFLLIMVILAQKASASAALSLSMLLKFAIGIFTGIALGWLSIQMIERQINERLKQNLMVKLLYHLGAVLLIRVVFQLLPFAPTPPDSKAVFMIQWGILPLLIVTYVMIFHLFEQKENAHQLEKTMLATQLRQLKIQNNPHFLLNSLNLLHMELTQSPTTAADLLLDLSDFMRVNLDISELDLISLNQELEVCEGYLFLQQKRFKERLQYSIDIEPAVMNVAVPPLLLQPLVENSVKYSVAPYSRPGIIKISALRGSEPDTAKIIICDNGPGFDINHTTGTGIKLLKRTLQLHYKDNYQLKTQLKAQQFSLIIEIPNQNNMD